MGNKKVAGLWIDSEKAVLVKNHDSQHVTEFSVANTFKHEKQHGNSNENTGNNSEQTTKTKFFKEIDKALENSEELFITGPGTIQEELKNYLNDTAQFKDLKIVLESSQQMNENELVESVKAHFGA